jgi:hypothetical protein
MATKGAYAERSQAPLSPNLCKKGRLKLLGRMRGRPGIDTKNGSASSSICHQHIQKLVWPDASSLTDRGPAGAIVPDLSALILSLYHIPFIVKI